jgi:hypothetical protein
VRLRATSRVVGLVALASVVLTACSGSDVHIGADATAAEAQPPSCPAVTLVRSGKQTSGLDVDNASGTWDLTTAVWDENAPDPIEYPVRSDAWTLGCIDGGTVHGNVPRSWTRDQWYDGEDDGTRLGGDAFRQTLTETPGNFLVIRNAYVEDFEDAYDPNSPDPSYTTYLDHVWARYIRDDCIENEDVPHSMVVSNSLFDGCFAAFAQRPKGEESARNGDGPQFFTVRNSLVYVKPQPLGPDYCNTEAVALGRCRPTGRPGVWLGAYGIWKWSEDAASRVTVRNVIFRLDMPSYSSCSSQRWPAGTYEDVTVVWLGHGRYRKAGGCTNHLPRGVELTRDIRVWRAAKRAWLAQ